MTSSTLPRGLSVWAISVIAVVFGLLTLKEGGVLQTDDRNPYRENSPNFEIELARNADGLPEARPGGFHFGNSVYKRVEAPRR